MLQHICSYIDNILINCKNDEQNTFEQNVVANLASELFDGAKSRFKVNNFKNK